MPDLQALADYITPGKDSSDAVRNEDSGCNVPSPFSGTAYEYLEALVDTGGRRSGTQGYRCAAAFCRDQLDSLGYRVVEQEYGFPYYQFDLAEVEVLRKSDGRKFPAYPAHYSMPAGEHRKGRLVRPRRDLTGCFVYVHRTMFSGDI